MLKHKSKVLIVDDLQANRYTLQCILEKLDITLIHADSGDAALRLILSHNFAVILLDVEMPGIDGYETAKLIHGNSRFKDVPIVMVTASDNSKEVYMKAYEAGAVDFITKPVEPIILINKVNQFVELDRQRLTAELAHMEQQQAAAQMQVLLNSAGEGILGIDLCGNISFANPKACELLDINNETLLKMQFQDFLYIDRIDEESCEMSLGRSDIVGLLNQRENSHINKERWVTASGNSFYVEYSCEITEDKNGESSGGVIMFQNITERKAIEEKMVHLANYDPLTNLANRAYFYDALTRAIARSSRSKSILAVLFLDLDHFKNINDSLGHDAGDLLLQIVGEKIVRCIRAGDLVARIGGDEFAIILHDLKSVTAPVTISEKIIRCINKPIDLYGKSVNTSTSIGIAVFDDRNMALDDLVKAADTAMYAAKSEGRNNFQFFEISMQRKAEEKNRIQMLLHRAVSNKELSVFYQPKVSIGSNKVIGFEALVRWTTKDGLVISPNSFIPIAEESGQIHEIGEWVFDEVCKQIGCWSKLKGFADLVVSVNVSARQLKTAGFHEIVKSTLAKAGIDSNHVELELTETALMTDPQSAAMELKAIHSLGVQIAVDDFGTGYSSLNYLKRFPIDVLKIDRSFVKDIGEDHNDEGIIMIVVAIAHTMGIQVIAEGVETEQQLAFLSSIGCDLIQGYYFSKPLDTSKTTSLIENIESSYQTQFDGFYAYMKKNNMKPMAKNILQ